MANIKFSALSNLSALAGADKFVGIQGGGVGLGSVTQLSTFMWASPTLVTPALGTPASGVLTNATGLPVATGISGLGTGVSTLLGVNIGSAGAAVAFNGALGTPSSGVGTNLTGTAAGLTAGVATKALGLGTSGATVVGSAAAPPTTGQVPVATSATTFDWQSLPGGGDALTSGSLAQFAATTSAQLAGVLTNPTGTGLFVLNNGPTLIAPVLGTPASGVATNLTGLPVATGISGLGTGIATALAVNVGSAGAPALINGALGTPSSGTLTNATGLPIASGVSGLATGIATFLATPSSANLAAAVTNETGSGALVFATSPTLVTPALGTPASGTLTNCTGLPLETGVTGALPLLINAQTGTTYTYLAGDAGKSVTHSNASAIAGTLPQATGSFAAGWQMTVLNKGAGLLTITPTTSTIAGAATLKLSQGQGALVVSDGTNYDAYVFVSQNQALRQVTLIMGDGVNNLAANDISVAFSIAAAGTLKAWTMMVDAGTATVKVWKKATGTAIPTISDVINTSGVAVASGTSSGRSTTLSDFTTSAFAANDFFRMQATAVSGVKWISLTLEFEAK